MLNVPILERWSVGPRYSRWVYAPEGCHLRNNPVQSTPWRRVLGIEGIRRLEPAPVVAEVQVNRVAVGEVDNPRGRTGFLRCLCREDRELWRIQEPASIQTACGDEVPPVLTPVREIGRHVGCSKRSVGSGHTAVRRGHTLARARGRYNHNTGLASVFCRRRAAR